MFFFDRKISLETDRLLLRPPKQRDFAQWANLRHESRAFLKPWDPTWSRDHLTRKYFANRVDWSQRSVNNGTAYPLLIFGKTDQRLVGSITLDNIRRGPSQVGTVGYWVGQPYANRGYMKEALKRVVDFAFFKVNISRLEAACLPENAPSPRGFGENRFKYEGVAQAYIQIDGRWRTHVLYASLRNDRRGKTDIGVG